MINKSGKTLALNGALLFAMVAVMLDPAAALPPKSVVDVKGSDALIGAAKAIPFLHGEVLVPTSGQLLAGAARIKCSELEVALSETSPPQASSGLPEEVIVSTSALTGSIGSGKCEYSLPIPAGKLISIVLLASPRAPACQAGMQGPFVKATDDRPVSFGPIRMARTEHLRQDLSIAFVGCV